MVYKPTSDGIYSMIKLLMKTRLPAFNPHREGPAHVVEQECEIESEAKHHIHKITTFFYGSVNEIKKKDEVQKALSNRTIKGLLKKAKGSLVGKFKDESLVINFLAKFSIYPSWDILDTTEDIKNKIKDYRPAG